MKLHTVLFFITRLFLEQTAEAHAMFKEIPPNTSTSTSVGTATATSTSIDTGTYDVVIGFKVTGYHDCVDKVSKADTIPPYIAPWKTSPMGAELSPQAFCKQLYPNGGNICDPGPNNALCTNGNQPHWDSVACRWTCAYPNGSCSAGNGGPQVVTEIDCAPGYQRVDDAATCSAQCVAIACTQVMLVCPSGQHAITLPNSCQQTCVPDTTANSCPPQDPPSIQCSVGSHLARDPVTCGWACFAGYGAD